MRCGCDSVIMECEQHRTEREACEEERKAQTCLLAKRLENIRDKLSQSYWEEYTIDGTTCEEVRTDYVDQSAMDEIDAELNAIVAQLRKETP